MTPTLDRLAALQRLHDLKAYRPLESFTGFRCSTFMTDEARLALFMSKTVKADNGCLLWTAHRGHAGYGTFWNGKTMARAHRWAYEHLVGPIPEGLNVLHTCDTPACVNVQHLFLGTHDENMADRQRKGRTRLPHPGLGERHHSSKLTEAQVREIRKRYARGGVTQIALAREYGVHQVLISQVVLKKVWAHVD